MATLISSDLRRAVRFLNDYCAPSETPDYTEYTQHVLDGLQRLIDSDLWALGEFEKLNDATEAVVTIAPREFRLPPLELFFGADGAHAHLDWYGSMRKSLRLSDVMSPSRLHEHPVYREFYRLIDAEDALFTLFNTSPAMFLGSTRGSTVPIRDKQLFDLLVGPITHNLKNTRALANLERRQRLMAHALAKVCPAVVVADRQGKIIAEANIVRDLLLSYFKTEAFSDSLPETLMQFGKAQRARLTKLGGNPAPNQELCVVRDGHRLSVSVAMQSNGYIFTLREESTTQRTHHLLRLGLSRREAEVLHFVAMGKTNGEIAIILGISRLTVGKHMEHIFQCLGVETRTAAAALAIEEYGRAEK